LPASP